MRTAWLTVLLLPFLTACRLGGERSPSAENDRLRVLVHQQEDQLAALTGEREELKAKLSEGVAAPGPGVPAAAPLGPEALAAIPTVTALEISGFSGFDPADPAAAPTSLAVNFRTLDGRGRFTQAVGTATVHVYRLPSPADTPPAELGAATLTPGPLRDAYRSGLTGTYYAAALPLSQPVKRSEGVLVRVEFADAFTGKTLSADRVIQSRGQ